MTMKNFPASIDSILRTPFRGGDLLTPEEGERIRKSSISHAELSRACSVSNDVVMVSTRNGDAQLRSLLAKGYRITDHRGTMYLLER